jgi:hypothetical protein
VAACALDAARWVSVGSIANVASGGELTVSDGEGLGSRARLVAGLAWCGYLDCGAGGSALRSPPII